MYSYLHGVPSLLDPTAFNGITVNIMPPTVSECSNYV